MLEFLRQYREIPSPNLTGNWKAARADIDGSLDWFAR